MSEMVSFTDLNPRSTTGNVPLIGDIIPSRWSYEALAVTSFTDNKYKRPFFAVEKKKFETQYYNMGLLYELQSQLETLKDEQQRGKEVNPNHMEVIRTNLPLVTEYCGMKPYQGDESYQSLYDYMKEAENLLAKRSNELTLEAEKYISAFIRNHSKEYLLELKRKYSNTKLEDCVIGADQKRMVEVIDNYVVPRTGLIFLTPRSTMGRAPFYSSLKILGSWKIKTLYFNMGVMLLMCIITIILLLTDCPGRYMRKSDN